MAKRNKKVSKKTASFKPKLFSPNVVNTAKRGPIRKTAQVLGGGMGSGGAGSGGSGSSQSVAQSPLYYDYRWSTPDKFYFPKNRVVANSIWREVYKRDPAVATGTDMYSEMPWSDFDLVGIEDSHIRHVYEDMFSRINIVPKLPNFTRDYLITGELVLHNIFNSTLGIWERIIPHNPDYVKVEGVGLALDQPLMWLLPTPEIKRLVNSADPRIRRLQKLLPKEIVNAFRMNREVPLDALNTTFLARRNSSTDIRGTSLYTRMFRVIMYEDFIVNASLAVAQRNAAPLRIFKLGDPNSGWLPDEDDQAAFAEMLSMAEADPLAAIIMHHNVSCELVGVSDRVLLISREWDFIERVKLLAMGVSKSFLVGEASFASAVAGLQTLMQRLDSLRRMFESEWISKKLCEPIAEIQEFYKRPQHELEHRIRVKKPLDEMELIVPQIKWNKSLEATQDVAILNVWRDLKERGILSERTYASGAGIDINTERKNISEERTFKQEHPEIYGVPQQPGKPPAGPAGPGGKPPPAVPPQPPPASIKRRGSNGSGVTLGASDLDALEDKLRMATDSENKLSVEDVLETLEEELYHKNQEDDLDTRAKAALEAANIPIADKSLLAGK